MPSNSKEKIELEGWRPGNPADPFIPSVGVRFYE